MKKIIVSIIIVSFLLICYLFTISVYTYRTDEFGIKKINKITGTYTYVKTKEEKEKEKILRKHEDEIDECTLNLLNTSENDPYRAKRNCKIECYFIYETLKQNNDYEQLVKKLRIEFDKFRYAEEEEILKYLNKTYPSLVHIMIEDDSMEEEHDDYEYEDRFGISHG